MFLSFHGPPPRFSAHDRSRLDLPPRPPLVRPSPPRAPGLSTRCAAPFPRAASRPAPERDHHVAAMRRRCPPCCSHGLPPRCAAPVPAHRVPTAPEHARRVATMRRRCPPRGSHGLTPLHARAYTYRAALRRAASRPAPERDRRVATMRRRRPPRGSRGLPPPPRGRLLMPDTAASSSFLLPLSQTCASSSRTHHELAVAASPAAYPLPRLHSSIPAA